MTEYGRFFDGVSYGEADQAEVQSRMVRDGVCYGVASELAVTSGGTGFANVATGEAWVQGFWYKNDAVKVLAVASNPTAVTRVDRVVLRLDRTGNTLTAVVKQGVLGAGLPALTQIPGGIWELPLAQISTTSGVSTYTDDRQWQTNLYNPMTAAGDIIVADARGNPTRMAKGASNRLLGVDGSGVLGYRQLIAGDVPTGLITSAMIADLTIQGGDIANGTINSAQVGVGASGIHGNRLVPLSVTAAEMANDTITSAKIVTGHIGVAAAVNAPSDTLTGNGGWQFMTGFALTINCQQGDRGLMFASFAPTANPGANFSFAITGANSVATYNTLATCDTRFIQGISYGAVTPFLSAGATTFWVIQLASAGVAVSNNAGSLVPTLCVILFRRPASS